MINARFISWLRLAALVLFLPMGASAQPAAGGSADAAPIGSNAGTGGAAPRLDPRLPWIESISRQEVVRGSPVTVKGRNLGTDSKLISLFLDEVPIGHPIVADGQSFTFIVPAEVGPPKERRPLRLGPTLLRVSIESPLQVSQMVADPYEQAQLHVKSDAKEPIELTAVSPRAVTRADMNRVTLLGNHFPANGRDLTLLIDDVEVPLCWKNGKDCDGPRASSSSHQLVIEGKLDPEVWSGTHQLALRMGEHPVTPSLAFTLTEYDSASIRWRAVGVGAALLVLILLIAIAGGTYATRGTRYVVRAFLIDAETEAYSLSKLQFFAWSVAALLGYCYLALSHFLVQERFELPPLPDGLATMLGMSAGTAVLSIGITAVKGPKASGEAEPSFSDLISVGGLVSPERFQFFLWTCVSILAFLFSALRMDPLEINVLPAIPDSLLTLSGVSSAGFLGGKLVRGPGPVISEVLVTGGSLAFTIYGRNLDRFARFEINGKSIMSLLTREPGRPGTQRAGRGDDNGDHTLRAETLEPESGARSKGFAKSLKVVLHRPADEWLRYQDAAPDEFELTVINEDGQRAAYDLAVPREVWQKFIPRTPATGETPPNPTTPNPPPQANG